jgi:hypothetical protein
MKRWRNWEMGSYRDERSGVRLFAVRERTPIRDKFSGVGLRVNGRGFYFCRWSTRAMVV